MTTISLCNGLSIYLGKRLLKKENKYTKSQPIFPFGFNLSQKVLTEKALFEQVSVIEGSPGMGKTQPILNIIANAIMDNKT